MTKEFRLDPPPFSLQSPLVQLRDYYSALVVEYERLAALARDKLAHVEALLSSWLESSTNSEATYSDTAQKLAFATTHNGFIPHAEDGNGSVEGTRGFLAQAASGVVASDEPYETLTNSGVILNGTPPHLDSSLELKSDSPRVAPGATARSETLNKGADLTLEPHSERVNPGGVAQDELEEKALSSHGDSSQVNRFIESLSSSYRALLNSCVQQGEVRLLDLPGGGEGLSITTPNEAVHKRITRWLPTLTERWVRFVGSCSRLVLATSKDPIDAQRLPSLKEGWVEYKEIWVPDRAATNDLKNKGIYTIWKHQSHNWLVVVPQVDWEPNRKGFVTKSPTVPAIGSPESPLDDNTGVFSDAVDAATSSASSSTSKDNSLVATHLKAARRFVERHTPNSQPIGSALFSDEKTAAPVLSSGQESVEMLPPFRGLNRFEAIEKVLTEHKGTVLHIDFVVFELYGDLKGKVSPDSFKAIKSQIGTALSHGKVHKRWASVPDSPGCYTQDLSLVEPAPEIRS